MCQVTWLISNSSGTKVWQDVEEIKIAHVAHLKTKSSLAYIRRGNTSFSNTPNKGDKELRRVRYDRQGIRNRLWGKIESMNDIVVRWKIQKRVVLFECVVVFELVSSTYWCRIHCYSDINCNSLLSARDFSLIKKGFWHKFFGVIIAFLFLLIKGIFVFRFIIANIIYVEGLFPTVISLFCLHLSLCFYP